MNPTSFAVNVFKTLSHQDLFGLKINEVGAFWTLRLFCWKDGSVPAAPQKLAVLCRCTEKQMERILAGIGHLLKPHPHDPNRLVMPLVEKDRREQRGEAQPPRARKPRESKPRPKHGQDREDRSPATSPAPQPATATATPDAPKKASAKRPQVASPRRKETDRRPTGPREATANEAGRRETAPKETPPREVPNRTASPPGPGPSPGFVLLEGSKGSNRSRPSFFEQQESVFDAHDFGLRLLSEARGELFLAPERKVTERRRAVAAAIRKVGLPMARQAARNAPLAPPLNNPDDGAPLDIVQAMRAPQVYAALFQGPEEELAHVIDRHTHPTETVKV